MEPWNKNDEFRMKYVKCNIRSTLRRFRTVDGRSLDPDEEPLLWLTIDNSCSTTLARVNTENKTIVKISNLFNIKTLKLRI